MKFLHIQHIKDSFFALSPEKQAEIMAGAMAFADKYLKNGKMKMAWFFSSMKGNASIWDIESSEEAMRSALEYPLTPYIELERIPIVEYEEAARTYKEVMKAAKKAAKK